jgi:eukaryotic-like serine/threonine-protein kinase
MDAFAAELEACLAELDRGEDGSATTVIPAAQRLKTPRRHKPVSPVPILIGLAGALAIAAIVVGLLTLGGNDNAVPVGAQVSISAVTSYDPFGDQTEHDKQVPLATDGDPGTYWSTEYYRSGLEAVKQGVGLVVDAHGAVQLSRITIVTDTPGYTAEIRATNIEGGTPTTVSDSQVVSGTTRFEIHQSAGPKRFYVVWITKLAPDGHFAHINEVRAFGKG